MGGITDAIGGIFGGGGDDGADAARDAAGIQAQYQREALEYLKEREAIPQQYREGALTTLAGLYGLPGGQVDVGSGSQPSYGGGMIGGLMNEISQGQDGRTIDVQPANSSAAMARLMSSPLYQATLGNLGEQEDAILRNQSATGGLRSGGTDLMLAENQRRNRLEATQRALGGLQQMAGLPSNASQIAQQTSNIGQTLGQGIIGAEQSAQAGQQAGFGNLMGLGQLGLSAFAAFCDPALKENVKKIGEAGGYNIYEWDWNEKAQAMGAVGKGVGPMADEIERFEPERIEIRNGYKYVRAANGH